MFYRTLIKPRDTPNKQIEITILVYRLESKYVDWLITDDFNEIKYPTKHDGLGQLEFYHVVCGLIEIDSIGGPFTWSKRLGLQHTKTKLDKALRSISWMSQWPQFWTTLLFSNSSDHTNLYI